MFCQNRNTQMPEDGSSCPFYEGEKLNSTQKKHSAKWFVIGGVALTAIVTAVLIILLSGGKEKELLGKWSAVSEKYNYMEETISFNFKENGICEFELACKYSNDFKDRNEHVTYEYKTEDDALILKTSDIGDTTVVLSCRYKIEGNTLNLTPYSSKAYRNGEFLQENTDFEEDDILILSKQY